MSWLAEKNETNKAKIAVVWRLFTGKVLISIGVKLSIIQLTNGYGGPQ